MNILTKSLIAISLVSSSTFALANTADPQMPVFEVTYVENVDVVKQQTRHLLQQMDYKLTLDISRQARNSIETEILNLAQESNLYAISAKAQTTKLYSE
ncbi:hypothetical protein [Thalassotalea crassostreae]|uniref:hypothetical protein n=1 Tax=Thalassotalea crassostreae TaxID=1763536 RepID=UPI000837B947|nr:hypothetical protein [Thalassotalea crassostreae]